jgi:polysaccharide pyruvyl transferase WcaK-like protein
MQNAGDDAFIEVTNWGAAEFWKQEECYFVTPRMPQLIHRAQSIWPFASYAALARGLWQIARSSVFVSAGGSTFHSAFHAQDLRTYAWLKKKLGFSGATGAIGISLGPYTSVKAEKQHIAYLKSLDFLALRDTPSFELAMSYNLPYLPVRAFDLAALLPDVPGINLSCPFQHDGKPILGISVCNYESYTQGDLVHEKQRNAFIAALLLELMLLGDFHYRFFIFNGHPELGDEALTQELIEKVQRSYPAFDYEVVPYEANVARTFSAIAQCQAMLSTRMHASIFACYAGIPFFLMEYHRKCTDFLDDVGQHPAYRLCDGELAPQQVALTMAAALSAQEVHRPRHLAETRARALLNFTATFQP